jgi:hypothetical protein
MITIPERTPAQGELLNRVKNAAIQAVHCSMPGTVVSFDAVKQTVVVQPAIKERVILDGKATWQSLPPLPDVPIVVPRAGGYVLSLPVAPGDECLIVFGDQCIDGWWQSGGVQMQIDKRRHDLSDGFAIMGAWSQPRVLSGYSTDSVQLRGEDGTTYLEVKGHVVNVLAADQVNVTATSKAVVTAPEVDVNASTSCTITCPQIGLSGAWGGLHAFVLATFKTLFNYHTHAYVNYPSGSMATGKPDDAFQMDDTHITSKVKGL